MVRIFSKHSLVPFIVRTHRVLNINRILLQSHARYSDGDIAHIRGSWVICRLMDDRLRETSSQHFVFSILPMTFECSFASSSRRRWYFHRWRSHTVGHTHITIQNIFYYSNINDENTQFESRRPYVSMCVRVRMCVVHSACQIDVQKIRRISI